MISLRYHNDIICKSISPRYLFNIIIISIRYCLKIQGFCKELGGNAIIIWRNESNFLKREKIKGHIIKSECNRNGNIKQSSENNMKKEENSSKREQKLEDVFAGQDRG
ncbi:unnamed protein product [Rhizophagus irregularis]|nr:unnamed protein product [Rhizophagus irregularis]